MLFSWSEAYPITLYWIIYLSYRHASLWYRRGSVAHQLCRTEVSTRLWHQGYSLPMGTKSNELECWTWAKCPPFINNYKKLMDWSMHTNSRRKKPIPWGWDQGLSARCMVIWHSINRQSLEFGTGILKKTFLPPLPSSLFLSLTLSVPPFLLSFFFLLLSFPIFCITFCKDICFYLSHNIIHIYKVQYDFQ